MKLGVALMCVGVVLACSRERESASSPPIATVEPASEAGVVAKRKEPIVVDEAREVPSLVGQLVTLVGEQTRTKQPTVLGVDVDGDHELSDQTVQVTGILRRTVVERDPNEGAAPGEIVATRGAGTYYSIVDPATGRLARPVKAR